MKFVSVNSNFSETTITDYLCAVLKKKFGHNVRKYNQSHEEPKNGSDFSVIFKNDLHTRYFQAKRVYYKNEVNSIQFDTVDRKDKIDEIIQKLILHTPNVNQLLVRLLIFYYSELKSQVELQYLHCLLHNKIPYFMFYNSCHDQEHKPSIHSIIVTPTQDLFIYLRDNGLLRGKATELNICDIFRISYDISLKKLINNQGFFFFYSNKSPFSSKNFLAQNFDQTKGQEFIEQFLNGFQEFHSEISKKRWYRFLASQSADEFKKGMENQPIQLFQDDEIQRTIRLIGTTLTRLNENFNGTYGKFVDFNSETLIIVP